MENVSISVIYEKVEKEKEKNKKIPIIPSR